MGIIYLAGPCDSEHRTMMVEIVKILREQGNSVYAPFELKIPNAWDMSQEEWAQRVFNEDVKAIKNCEEFLMVSLGRESTAGTNWEQGFAYSLYKYVRVFQLGSAATSLMTYCGCDGFYNCKDFDELKEKIRNRKIPSDKKCETTLT